MQDYTIIDSIEKYDSITDAWTIMYFKLPKPLAKLGSVLLTDEQILIVGGMSRDFEPSAETFELSLVNLEWTQKASMGEPRLVSSGLIFSEDNNDEKFVYAIGGNKSHMCERYSHQDEQWELIPSFKEKVDLDPFYGSNYLFSYSFCSTFNF